MARDKQQSFAGGEISPSLHGHSDLAKYAIGLAEAYNLVVLPEGGVVNRRGMRFAQQSPTSIIGGRLIRFSFNVEQQYALEFGNLFMRVIKDGSYVYEPAKTITGATQANPCVVTVATHGYSNGDEVFIDDVVGMTELNDRSFLVANVAASTFELQDLDGNNIDSSGFGIYSSGGTSERVYELVTPYAIADLMADPNDQTEPGIKFTQSADVMTITHPSYTTRDLTRTAHDSWTLTEVTYSPDQPEPTAISVTVNTTGTATVGYTVTAVSEDGEESLAGTESGGRTISAITKANPAVVTLAAAHPFNVGDEVYIDNGGDMVEVNDRRFIVASVSGNDIGLRDEDSTGHTTYTSGGALYGAYEEVTNSAAHGSEDNTISWTSAAGAVSYNVYKRQRGLFGFIGSTILTTYTDDGDTPNQAEVPFTFRNPFHDKPPGSTTYYEQRQWYAGQDDDPQVLHGSQSAAFNNFGRSFPGQDSDAIKRRLNAAEANAIRHLVPLTDLLVMTSRAEWAVTGASDVITPTSITARPQSYHGSSHVPPLTVGNLALYVQRRGRVVRDIGYQPSDEGKLFYASNDRTILAQHLFEDFKITDWTYVGEPEHLVYAVREDGIACVMTFLPSQDIYAWSRMETRGEIESVCAIEENNEPVVYFLVKRRINGVVKRFIEYVERRYFDQVEDAFFIDAGLTLDTSFAITGFTNANPVVVTTATAHGFSNGDTVDITKVRVTPDSDAVDATADDDLINSYEYGEINKDGFLAANVTATTFELQDSDANNIDGTGWRVYSDGGEARKALTQVTGLWHLIGEEVYGLANGAYVGPLLVDSAGTVTLVDPASRIHLGLPYYSEMETLDLDFEAGDGNAEGRRARISKVFLKVDRSQGLSIGPARDSLFPMKQAQDALATGVIGQSIRRKISRQGRLVVRQNNPLPMHVLSVLTDPEVEDG